MRVMLLALAILAGAALLGLEATRGAFAARDAAAAVARIDPCPHPQPVPDALRLPPAAQIPPGEPTAIEQKMLRYLYGDDPNHVPSNSPNLYPYRRLGWCVDKYVRDTGPYVHGQYYGTHPAVRIYYSPEAMAWLRGGRRGVPADGAVIIKEQYPAPAAMYGNTHGDALKPLDWTVMIRRTSASRDGWFWAEVYTKTTPTGKGMTFGGTQYPNAGFGLYCLRCHASANVATTFASLENIKDYPGEPLVFKVDDTWRTPPPAAPEQAVSKQLDREHEKNAVLATHLRVTVLPASLQRFPDEPLDSFGSRPHAQVPPQFMTSDQCMGCHGASSGPPSGPSMWLDPPQSWTPPPAPATPPPAPVGVNVSEYGEWRWSPMGLAGRDPVFFSQLESELAYIEAIPAKEIAGDHPHQTRETLERQVVDTCMQCHGVMGKRTNDIDHGGAAHFDEKWVFARDPSNPGFHYGGLARDGVSCTVCHHIMQTKREDASLAYVLEHKNTGLFDVGKPDVLHGPFHNDTIATHPMNESLGAKPVFAAITTSAHMCTSCHSINLPIIDAPDKIHPIVPAMAHDVEQNTYVEWVNSRFQTERMPRAGAQSCQDCHMPAGVANQRLDVNQTAIQTRIALVEDESYPQAEHAAPIDQITVHYRQKGFRRHELLGLNAFLLRTFQVQPNTDVLGVRLPDYMSGSSTDLEDAIGNVVYQARHASAKLDLATRVDSGALVATVGVTNLTGHRFPTGVGFRRAFIELVVEDPAGNVVWSSGRTNALGEIVDGSDGKTVLPTEYFERGPDGKQRSQPHFDERHVISRTDQVQIYEELVRDKAGDFTESFIRRDATFKDNRLLPQGYRYGGVPGIPLPAHWLDATHPHGTGDDPHYRNDKGRAAVTYRIVPQTAVDPSHLRVRATLYYQAWEPYFKRLRTTGTGPAAQRLSFLLDPAHLRLENTPLANWKLEIDSISSPKT
jgi:mono/diheme cytochrome c family protein